MRGAISGWFFRYLWPADAGPVGIGGSTATRRACASHGVVNYFLLKVEARAAFNNLRLLQAERKYCRRPGRVAILAAMPDHPPPPTPTWIIYRAADKVELVGRVEATDQREAIEKAAKLYRVPAAKLIAVFRGQASSGGS
jgi:hypothetical protein